MNLRPYQTGAIAQLRAKVIAGQKRLLLVSPTGSGKTLMFCAVIRATVAKGNRALVLAHRRELISQASAKLTAFGVPHGVVLAGVAPSPDMPVQVASVPTLIRREGAVAGAELVVVDEAHHTAAKSYETILARFPDAIVLGVTATPWRQDGKGLADLYPAHVLAASPRELRDQGYLVQVGGWEYEAPDTSGAQVRGGDFVAADLAEAATAKKIVGDIVGEWQAQAFGRRTVAFACSVEHSRALVAAFRAAGVAAEHLDGETPTEEREGILARLRSGETRVVSNCMVLTEGWDCPEAEVAILARPTLSTALYLQMVGRVLRPCPGKTSARIHDHAGCLAAHGHPYAPRDYSPEHDSKADRKTVDKKVRRRKCPTCGSVLSGWPCDACGAQQPLEERRLIEVEAQRRNAIGADGMARGTQKKNSDEERAALWRRRFAGDVTAQRAFVARMVARHGPKKAPWVCNWFSGYSWRVPAEWLREGAGVDAP